MPLPVNGNGHSNGNGNGFVTKVVGVIVALALSTVAAMLRASIEDLRTEIRSISGLQQMRGERITAAEAKAGNNTARIERLEGVMDKQVTSNSQKIETLEERLRKVERTR